MSERIVVVGAGQAAAQAVASLRSGGHPGPVVIVGEESYPPYQRPPLSKAFLSGEMARERLAFKPAEFYGEIGEIRLSTRACEIDRSNQRVRLDSEGSLAYDKLLIATGARVRLIPVPGADLPGVHSLRTIDDAIALREDFKSGANIVVIGGGYIGLEVAAVASKLGLKATVIELEPRCLARVTSPEVSAFFEGVHRARGVTIRTGEGLSAFEGCERLRAVHTASGERIEVDLALVAVGILPNVDLAEVSGLSCSNGIVVDEFARTSDPNIYAAGDCANLPSAVYGRRVRLESVHNAIEQARTAAGGLLGSPVAYDPVPWFWSDQYDLKLQIAGLSQGYDRVVIRGEPDTKKFAAFYLKSGRLIAVDAVNTPQEYMAGRKLIAKGAEIDPERLADTSISMKEMTA